MPPRDEQKPIDVLAVAPLPFLSNGKPTFQLGVTIFYAELFSRLASAGHRVRVVAEAPEAAVGEKRSGLPWRIPNLRVDWFAVGYRSGTLPATDAFRRRLAAEIGPIFLAHCERRRPDVVLIGREILAPYVAGLCREYGLPCVVVAHGVAIAALLEGAYPQRERRRLIAGLRSAQSVIAVAKHLEDELRTIGIARVTAIPNVADATRFRPRPRAASLLRALRIPSHAPVVGHFSTLRPVKCPLDIIASARIVLRSRPDAMYLVVGDGPSRAETEELARQTRVADRFRFAGEVDHARVPAYMNLCDVIVVPSERESLPLVFREAQACGCVVLASDIAAAREAIVDGETGVLFPVRSIRGLADATLALLDDRRRREQIGQQARASVLRQTARWTRAYADVLRRAATSNRGPRSGKFAPFT